MLIKLQLRRKYNYNEIISCVNEHVEKLKELEKENGHLALFALLMRRNNDR